VRELLQEVFHKHRGKIVGTAVGLAFGIGVMWVGVFWATFIGLCGGAGYLVGNFFDEREEGLAEAVEDLLLRTLKR